MLDPRTVARSVSRLLDTDELGRWGLGDLTNENGYQRTRSP
jgi:hypothetical protein